MLELERLARIWIDGYFGSQAQLLGTRRLATILFGVSSTDASTMLAVPAALLLTAAIACLIPGRRAARLDPAEILRE